MHHPSGCVGQIFLGCCSVSSSAVLPRPSGLGCTGPLARTKAVGLILAEVDECDGPITTVIRVAFERSYGGNCRVVVDVGGIGSSKWLRVMET